ncbi:restriction-modification enzyme subunit s3b [Ureaplasma urealyticum serovar 10 str. ATCC 33699]|uniref:Restriction-modification enzyme subunit s3b n=1 Tax=Ureaplasma urealyticum serovar 10 (strain ATCC 33699 / Western) TaxID=565575 RepID=B5ZAL4_UREU1|nr:restriction endonuclease subunit S [Ureaplasma urealyticum]ACI60134.1 restriction-modification enzyme subunit s3b [Ureaplasma urealyticum serovar 10 str. ATCC 33699]
MSIKLKDIIYAKRGSTITSNEFKINPGSYPLISASAQNNGVFGYINYYMYEGGHITISMNGNAGCVFYQKDKFSANSDVLVLSNIDNKISNNKFIFYWLKKHENTKIKSLCKGTTRLRLSNDDVLNLEINLPPIEEQNAIISIIEPHEKLFIKYSNLVDISSVENTKKDVDNLISIIEPIERIIKNLKAIKYKLETIMNNFFVVFYLFNNEENSNKYKLRNIGKFKGGISTLDKNNYDSGINFINYMDIYKNFVINDDIKLRLYNASEKDIKSYIVSYGDLLLTASSETKEEIAFSSVYLSNKQAIFNGFSKIYKYDQNILLPIYAAFYFRSEFFRKEVIKLATGYTRFNLSIKDAKNIEISINNFEFQKKFSKIVEPLLNLSTKANKIEKILNDSLLKITKKLIV